jgi:signal transduction histidine kinase
MKLFSFLNLRGIGGQLAALVVTSIVALHLIITVSFLINRPDRPDLPMAGHQFQLVFAAQLLAATPPAERPRLVGDLSRAYPKLELESLEQEPTLSTGPELSSRHELIRHLGAGYRVFPFTSDHRHIGIELPDGAMISTVIATPPRRSPFLGGPWMMTLLFAVISVMLLGLWAARALAAPLSSFAKTAETFSLDGGAAALPERGPEEVRALARALNRMRERITGLVDDRTKMLAAISHDLRTPITRLRLRAEFIEDETHRVRMLADLEQMRSMLDSVLSFLENDRRPESMTLTDIASSLQLVADQFSDMGRKVVYLGPDHAMATVRPNDLHRCMTNLVENAIRFGTESTICLTLFPEYAVIDVSDDGPGISEACKEAMLRPFVRGDSARNMDESAGFGLGLSIANAIVLAHGGELSLHDRAPRGLQVRIMLPIGARSQAAQAVDRVQRPAVGCA